MKKLILLLLGICLIVPIFVYGQTAIAPANVTKAFNLKYPAAHNIQWYNQGKDFKAVFKADGFIYQTKYNSGGDWLITQRTISMKDLPVEVKTNLSNGKFATWKVNSVFVLFLPGMITQYRIVVSNDNDIKNLLMSWDGKLLDENYNF